MIACGECGLACGECGVACGDGRVDGPGDGWCECVGVCDGDECVDGRDEAILESQLSQLKELVNSSARVLIMLLMLLIIVCY